MRFWRVLPPLSLGIVTLGLVLLTSQTIFPYLSNNHDESAYLFHARMLEQGKLWGETQASSEFFDGWLIVRDRNKIFSRYAPVFPGLLAASDILFKNMRVALALIGAGTVVTLYLVALELYRRPVALLASIFLMFSPLFLIQSSVFLPYMLSFLLNLLFLLFFLKGVRCSGWVNPLLAGVFIGIGSFSRIYTAFLFGVPVMGYATYLLIRRQISYKTILLMFAGYVPFAVISLAYNYLITGNAFVFPFNVGSPDDRLGFGMRRMLPIYPFQQYSLSVALTSTYAHLNSFMWWIFAGPLMVALLAFGVLWRADWKRDILLLGVGASILFGNMFQWGISAIVDNGMMKLLGPFYHLDLLLPLCVLGSHGFLQMTRFLRQPWARGADVVRPFEGAYRDGISVTGAVVLALTIPLVAVTAYLLGRALDANFRYTVKHAAIYSPIVNGRLDSALVFLPTPYGPFIHHPFGYLLNDPSFNGPVVYARNLGNENLGLMKTMPERRAYVYMYQGKFSERAEDVAPVSLLRIQPVEGRFLSVDMEAANTANKPFVWAYVWNDGKTLTYLLDDQSGAGKTYRFRWYVAADRLYFDGPNKGRMEASLGGLSHNTALHFSVAFSSTPLSSGDKPARRDIYEYRYWFSEKDGVLTLGAPGVPWRAMAWPDNAPVP
ncbi:MAG: glycosyltransferase family 39 protein, partial [Chloroflexota bacterium]